MTDGSLSEISQTNPSSQIILSYTRLFNNNAGGYGFSVAQVPTNLLFGLNETKAAGGANGWSTSNFNTVKYYLLSGTTLRSNAPNLAADASPFTTEQDCIVKHVFMNANAPVVSNGVMVANIYSNSVASSNLIYALSLSGAFISISNEIQTVKLTKGQALFIELSGGGATGDQTTFRSIQLNIGLF